MNPILSFVASIMIGTINSQEVRPFLQKTCLDHDSLDSQAGPCKDTDGCRMPLCCGVVAGSSVNLTMKYRARVDAHGGSVSWAIVGEIGTSADNPLLLTSTPPLRRVPKTLIGYNDDMCYVGPNKAFNPDFCPQTAGNEYTFTQLFKIPNNLPTSGTLVLVFQTLIENDSGTLICGRAYGRLIGPDI